MGQSNLPGDPGCPSSCQTHAFLGSNALNANEGPIVGVSGDASGNVHGFLWDRRGPMLDLSALIPPDSASRPMAPFVINDRAEIAGIGVLPDGSWHGFLMIPCGSGTEGCGSGAASRTTTTQGNSTLTMAQRIAIRQVVARSWIRFPQWYRIPSLGTPSD